MRTPIPVDTGRRTLAPPGPDRSLAWVIALAALILAAVAI